MKKWLNVLMVFLLSFLLAACGMAEPPAGAGDANKAPGVEGGNGTGKDLDLPGTMDTDKTSDQAKQEDADNEQLPENDEPELPEDGVYSSKEDVAKYIHLYGHLPSNYITKKGSRGIRMGRRLFGAIRSGKMHRREPVREL